MRGHLAASLDRPNPRPTYVSRTRRRHADSIYRLLRSDRTHTGGMPVDDENRGEDRRERGFVVLWSLRLSMAGLLLRMTGLYNRIHQIRTAGAETQNFRRSRLSREEARAWHPCVKYNHSHTVTGPSLTHPTAPAGTHVGDSDCVGGVLARSCSGAVLRQPGIPRRARGPI